MMFKKLATVIVFTALAASALAVPVDPIQAAAPPSQVAVSTAPGPINPSTVAPAGTVQNPSMAMIGTQAPTIDVDDVDVAADTENHSKWGGGGWGNWGCWGWPNWCNWCPWWCW
ncbi:hypothetical protein BG004_004338 [Podila humilis]|nr:hypothetical protein BG004_004338 [Podila humilis]